MTKMLIVSGGWDGHSPHEVADTVGEVFANLGWRVEFGREIEDFRRAVEFDVVVPNWTMGEIDAESAKALLIAVEGGVGLAGIHGGMGDAFRNCTEYQFMVGGQFVAHPGAGDRRYSVEFEPGWSLTDGLEDFEVETEKYYMHIDPAIRILATTRFEDFGDTLMPIAWMKRWGLGKVFYCSLGHSPNILKIPSVLKFVTRGIECVANKRAEVQGAPLK
ncbi:MAG: ThuA domain-containing protein [Fimbriimonadaceae bacterium]